MVNVPITHIEDDIIEKIYKKPRPEVTEQVGEKLIEDASNKWNATTILILIAFLTGLALSAIASYYVNGDMRHLNSTITEWKQDQYKASKNNAIIQRAVNDNKSIEQRQIKRASDVEQIMTQMLTPKSVTIK